jgi:hypothetical protein
LVVDAKAVLSGTVSFQCFQSISRRHAKVFGPFGGLKQREFPTRDTLNRLEATNALVGGQALGVLASKGADHPGQLYCFP